MGVDDTVIERISVEDLRADTSGVVIEQIASLAIGPSESRRGCRIGPTRVFGQAGISGEEASRVGRFELFKDYRSALIY